MFNDIVVKYDITHKCNYMCDYCTAEKNISYEPTKSDIDAMFENLASYTIKKFILFGGEPTLSQNIFYVLDKCVQQNIDEIDLCTNGENTDVLEQISKKYGKDRISIFYGIHLKHMNINKIKTNTKNFTNCLLNIVLDKRYKNRLPELKNFIDETNNRYWLSYIKTKTKYNTRKPFQTTIYSDFNFLKECSKLFNYKISKIYERFHTPRQHLKNICINNIVDILPNGNLIFENQDCFPNPTLGNIYTTPYIHNYESKLCTTLIPRNFGYCCWCKHKIIN